MMASVNFVNLKYLWFMFSIKWFNGHPSSFFFFFLLPPPLPSHRGHPNKTTRRGQQIQVLFPDGASSGGGGGLRRLLQRTHSTAHSTDPQHSHHAVHLRAHCLPAEGVVQLRAQILPLPLTPYALNLNPPSCNPTPLPLPIRALDQTRGTSQRL